MTKIRKVKRRKKYQYNVNRKRMNKKRIPASESARVQNAWNPRLSSQKNFKNLGLVFDVNKDIKSLNRSDSNQVVTAPVEKTNTDSFIKSLEEDAESTSTGKTFRFSKDQVDYITYLLDKHGDDYKAMSRDKKNYLQQTPNQLRYKINLFKSIPDHYKEYLKNKKVQ